MEKEPKSECCKVIALWERLGPDSDEGYYYCSKCGKALDD